MLTALTRAVGPTFDRCDLHLLDRQPIDVRKAGEQHQNYEACLRDLGVRVISLPPEPDLPDAVFVEDPAVVLDEFAILGTMRSETRRGESESLAMALAGFRPLRRLRDPATLEGGDVLRIGRTLYVGLSPRTNEAGIEQLASEAAPYGYSVRPVRVTGCMHLKTGCSSLSDGALLANRAWVDMTPFRELEILDAAPDEPWAANVLTAGKTVLIPKSFPATNAILNNSGFQTRVLDISELQKAEGGLTCLSILFESAGGTP